MEADYDWTCTCGKGYYRESDFNRHQNGCEAARKRLRRLDIQVFKKLKSNVKNPFGKRMRRDSGGSGRSHDLSAGGPSRISEQGNAPPELVRQDIPSLLRDNEDCGTDSLQASPAPPSTAATSEYNMDIETDFGGPFHDRDPSPPATEDHAPAPTPVPDPAIRVGTRTRRPTEKALAAREDPLPEGPGPLIDSEPPPAPVRRVTLYVSEKLTTAANRFGLSREYRRRPTRIPDLDASLATFMDKREATADSQQSPRKHRKILDIIFPYPNLSSFLFGDWFRSGSEKKTNSERRHMQKLFEDPNFDSRDIVGVNFDKIDKMLAQDVQSPFEGPGWRSHTVTIEVPTGIKKTKEVLRERATALSFQRRHGEVDPDARRIPVHEFHIPEAYTCSLVHIMKSLVTEDPAAKECHWHGFEEFWQPPDPAKPKERVYGELYSSEAFRHAERRLLSQPAEPDCDLPRVIFAFMFSSDATHVAQFGQASLWPGYAFCGNSSKYARCIPSARAAHHFAYFPKLPDAFEDFLRKHNLSGTPALRAHCRRELFHAVWKLILDGDFQEAYKHGIVLECIDGIKRRFYPRIFTYSADYPEKVLIALIRDMGNCPCPRCKIKKDSIRGVGTLADRSLRADLQRVKDKEYAQNVVDARKLVYEDGYVVNSDKVDDLLKSGSWVPTENAFSSQLGAEFLVFLILVIDLLHEFELGVWKALLIHLIRILNTLGSQKVAIFNERFRQVPNFGEHTIRRFAHNVSELKKLAARDYEDILQCIIPCFEGLLPSVDDESAILDLLYISAYWHSLSKLRMHTDSSLRELDQVTIALGNCLRNFADVTCSHYRTLETDSEVSARKRAEARTQNLTLTPQQTALATSSATRRPKIFNLATFKLHQIGYYADQIRHYGTTDSYSTQIGEAEHKIVKRRYARTNKKRIVSQIVKQDIVEETHARMREELQAALAAMSETKGSGDPEPTSERKRRDPASPYHIAAEQRTKLHLSSFIAEHKHDPAFAGFRRQLKCHLLARLQGNLGVGDEPNFSDYDLDALDFEYETIYPHATATFNYTSYDLRRERDTINVNSVRRHVMVLSNDTEGDAGHPFWYARVIGIYHANILYGHSSPRRKTRMDFLWVRWFGPEENWNSGPSALRLDRVAYVPQDGPSGAFGFLEPSKVVRACQLIPAFAFGKTSKLLSASSTYRDAADGDWESYYVNRFVDRDMMMRYLGLGVGHMNTANFCGDSGSLRPDVLVENNLMPWDTRSRSEAPNTTTDEPDGELEDPAPADEEMGEDLDLEGLDLNHEGEDEEDIDFVYDF